jgi:hypothetical protein
VTLAHLSLLYQIAIEVVRDGARGRKRQTGDGTVNLSGRVSRTQATGSEHWGLLPTHATDFGPDPEFLGPGSSMLCGSDVIAAEVEEVIDLIVG